MNILKFISVQKACFVTDNPLLLQACSLPRLHSQIHSFDIWFQKAEIAIRKTLTHGGIIH